MLKKLLSILMCLTLCFTIICSNGVQAANDYDLSLEEGEKYWLNVQDQLLGIETPSWSMNWTSNSSDVKILQKSYDLRQCLIQAVNNTGNTFAIVELSYKTLMSSGTYKTNWITFKIKVTCPHYFTGGTVVTQPTAGETGLMEGYCSKCGEKMTKIIPALGYKDFTGLEFTDATFDYDGTEKEISINTIPEGATVTYTSDTANKNKASNAGVYKVKATVSNPDYNDWTKEATLTIKPKNLTITGLTAQSRTYDGTDTAKLIGGTLNGVISEDDVAVNIPNGKFSDKNVGDNKMVSIADITLSGSKAGNYTLTQPKGLKANITQKEILVKANNQQMIKNGAKPEFTFTADKLFGDDKFSGELTTEADGTKVGDFSIVQGSLTAGKNYKITFTPGILKVSDKYLQSAEVSDITEKTYGDDGFNVAVKNDATPELGKFKFDSSDKNVAEIDEDGKVTIKNAGVTNITVRRDGNNTYEPFEKSQELKVGKVAINVTARNISKKVGTDDPDKFEYDVVGTLVNGDEFTGALIRESGENIGEYNILQGTLAINDNYEIIYNVGRFKILEKSQQKITIADFKERTYGGEKFKIDVTPDAESALTSFTYESDNESVATIDKNGEITIVGAGETNISVTEAGSKDYEQTTVSQKLVVNPKTVTVSEIDTDKKNAVLIGILETDTELVELDFDKINIELGEALNETTSEAVLKNFVLIGEKSGNYKIDNESVNVTITNNNVVDLTLNTENGKVTGGGKYFRGSEITIEATPDSGYTFGGWYDGEQVVSKDMSYTFRAESNIALTAKFIKIVYSSGGGSSATSYTVKFETNGGSEINSVKVGKNSTVTEPAVPVKEGYEFSGWYTNKDLTLKYDFSAKVTKSMTLYAEWTEQKTETENPEKEPPAQGNKIIFIDVKDNDWFAENIKFVVENGLMNGVTDTVFAPNDNLTRAMLVTILYRAEGEPAVNKDIPFADVMSDSYYSNAVIWAHQNGIVSGVSENKFAPDMNITREQIAAIIYRYAQYKGYDVSIKTELSEYKDSDEISEYAAEAMQYAVGNALINGKTKNELKPEENAIRAEIAAILQRFIKMNK